MKEILQKGMLYQYYLLLPATLGFIILSQEIVGFFYDYSSSVTADDIALTAWALVFYSIGMIGRAGRDLLTRASYAIENTRTPVMINGVSIVLYVILSWLLIKPMNYAGLALAYSLANLINMSLQSWFLRRQIGRLYERGFYISIVKGMVSGVIMCGAIWLMMGMTASFGKFQVPVLIGIAAIAYGSMLLLMKEQLLTELLLKVTNRLKRGGGTNEA